MHRCEGSGLRRLASWGVSGVLAVLVICGAWLFLEYRESAPERLEGEISRTGMSPDARLGILMRNFLAGKRYGEQAESFVDEVSFVRFADEQERMLELLEGWAREDLKGMSEWVLTEFPGLEGEEWLRKTVKALAPPKGRFEVVKPVDGYRLVAFCLEINRREGRDVFPAEEVLQMCLTHAPRLALRALDQPRRRPEMLRVECGFHLETDFAGMARYFNEKDNLAVWEPAAVPSNFLEEWAKREPEAALEYATEIEARGEGLYREGAVACVLVGMSEVSPPEKMVPLIKRMLEEAVFSHEPIAEAFMRSDYTECFILALDEMPVEMRDVIGTHCLPLAMKGWGAYGKFDRMKALRMFGTAKSRLKAVRNVIAGYGKLVGEVSVQLQELGHSEEDISLTMEASVKPAS